MSYFLLLPFNQSAIPPAASLIPTDKDNKSIFVPGIPT
jgi:hypothetical protein